MIGKVTRGEILNIVQERTTCKFITGETKEAKDGFFRAEVTFSDKFFCIQSSTEQGARQGVFEKVGLWLDAIEQPYIDRQCEVEELRQSEEDTLTLRSFVEGLEEMYGRIERR
jgi:hypothetical protein